VQTAAAVHLADVKAAPETTDDELRKAEAELRKAEETTADLRWSKTCLWQQHTALVIKACVAP
jgi:hypothetical protein